MAPAPGFSYNPGQAAWQPNLDHYPYYVAKKYLEGAVTGPAFTRFFAGKTGGTFPVAVLREELRKAISAQTQTVLLSDETLASHKKSHPEITLEDYQKLPIILDEAEIVTKEDDKYLVFIKLGGRYYHAVVKTTRDFMELYLLSLRYTNEEDIRRVLKRGKVVYRK